ncbi:MAG: PHP domain-containing protein [Balneolaceae bacterium]|nr:PHP domain-containing protein [Balneolaceae bacterium]
MGKADLHIHTTASDGLSTPVEIVESAVKHNLDVIAITDHDTISGVREAREAAKSTELEVISGVEITSDFKGKEAHLLAYCFDIDDPGINKLLSAHKKARVKRGKWIIEQLKNKGLDLDINEVKAEANGSNVGRPHIAAVLVDKGYVASFKEAFIRYLSNEALGPIQNEYYSAEEVIEHVKAAGGATVVAHPGQMYSIQELDIFKEMGIDGIEVMHPSHNYELQKKMEDFAENNLLIKTGGSDFHGGNRDYQKYFGVVTINTEVVYRMRQMTNQRKSISA